jgi:hypothetical protein
MEAVRTSETSVDNNFTWQYIPEDNSEHHGRTSPFFVYALRKQTFYGKEVFGFWSA